MTTTQLAKSVLITSIDTNGIERNLIIKKLYPSIFKVHHDGFIKADVSALSTWESDTLSDGGVKTINVSEVDLNNLYSLPAMPKENWEELTPETKTEIVISRNK